MRKSLFLMVICLSLWGSTFTEARAQWILFHCSRPTIETYPEEEKRPVLQYLDEARAVADKCARLLAEGRIKELYRLMSGNRRNEVSEAKFLEAIEADERNHGKILGYDFHEQHMSYGVAPDIDFDSVGASIQYIIKTTAREPGQYLNVYTMREGKETVISIFSRDLIRGLPRSRQPEASRCRLFEDHLKLRAPK